MCYTYDSLSRVTARTVKNATFAYDAYGKLISRTGVSDVIFGYNGRDGVVTDDNGLIYMRARYYSPEMKRFINADVVAGAIAASEFITNTATTVGTAFADGAKTAADWTNKNVVKPAGKFLSNYALFQQPPPVHLHKLKKEIIHMYKKRLLITGCFILFTAIVVGILIYMFNNPLTHEYFIFQNLEECERLVPADYSKAEVIQYDSPDSDKHLKELLFNDFWGINFKSDKLEYEIFAYEFVDSDTALKYYVDVTGQNSYKKKLPLKNEDENKLLNASKGMSSYEIVAVYQNRAYRLVAPKQYEDAINELLSSVFSQKLS